MRIGPKRNYCCQWARGEIIIHWDDDDWSAPGRMAEQVVRLSGGIAVTGYRSLLFWDERRHQAYRYTGSARYTLGTSLCYLRSWQRAHPFADLAIGEDNDFRARAQARLATVDGGEMMVARIHGGSTSPKQTGNIKQWTPLPATILPDGFLKMNGPKSK